MTSEGERTSKGNLINRNKSHDCVDDHPAPLHEASNAKVGRQQGYFEAKQRKAIHWASGILNLCSDLATET
jgi:hypothetical protein